MDYSPRSTTKPARAHKPIRQLGVFNNGLVQDCADIPMVSDDGQDLKRLMLCVSCCILSC